ncbi:MAG: bile acid:sodium symporter family protein [Gammaproteobacteria bacterium]|nr:bile acid:sodium symporter family protein [Gammaproteobacteria bacterium]
METFIDRLTRLFPLWALLFSLLAWFWPQWFTGLKPAILPLLALVMFGMGLTLRLDDFIRVLRMPRLIALGVALQFGLMPLFAWFIATGLALDPLLAAGMILVGSSPGGTASNVVTYLAKGNVALSISLTAVSTLLAVLLTPWLSWLYIQANIEVPILPMLQTILLLVILPVTAGILLNHFFKRVLTPVQSFFPLLSVLAIVLIIAIIVALNHQRLGELTGILILAVVLHNLAGVFAGYGITALSGYDRKECRALAIEVGMQNSGLAVALALKHFVSIAALPGALFSIWHNLSGSVLAGYWRRADSRSTIT